MDVGSVIVTVKERGTPGEGNYIPAGAYGVFTGFHKGFARVSLDLRPLKVERSEIAKEILRKSGQTDVDYIRLVSTSLPEDCITLVAESIEFDADFEEFIWSWHQLIRDVERFGFKYADE